MKPAWPKGLPTFYRRMYANRAAILRGTLVTIDPSIGSRTSQPGYAVFSRGILQASGTAYVDPGVDVYKRARLLYEILSILVPSPPDVLGVEGLGAWANVRTIWGAAMAVAAADAVVTIEVSIPFWKAYAATKPSYFKDDEQDALAMGEAMIAWCREQEVANDAA